MGEVLEFRARGLRPGFIKDAILQKCREVHLRDDFSQQMAQALQRVCDEYSLTAPILRLTIDGPENWQYEAVESVVRAAALDRPRPTHCRSRWRVSLAVL